MGSVADTKFLFRIRIRPAVSLGAGSGFESIIESGFESEIETGESEIETGFESRFQIQIRIRGQAQRPKLSKIMINFINCISYIQYMRIRTFISLTVWGVVGGHEGGGVGAGSQF
jgi:hypothetical protein